MYWFTNTEFAHMSDVYGVANGDGRGASQKDDNHSETKSAYIKKLGPILIAGLAEVDRSDDHLDWFTSLIPIKYT